MTIADQISKWLSENGHSHVFCLPGYLIDSIVQSITLNQNLKLISMTHESSCGYAADGFSRASNRLGVCLTIGSVGLSNAMTAALTAKGDHSPVLFISGGVSTTNRGSFPFQNTELDGSNDCQHMRLYTKGSFYVDEPDQIINILEFACKLALSEPQGPVHISIPVDIQVASVSPAEPLFTMSEKSPPEFEQFKLFEKTLKHSKRLLAILGSHDRSGVCRRFLDKYSIPTVTTLGAKGALGSEDLHYLGNYGFFGQEFANEAVLSRDVDTLLLLDVTLSERNTFGWDNRIVSGRRILALGSYLPKFFNEVEYLSSEAPAYELLHQLTSLSLEKALISRKGENLNWIESKRAEYQLSNEPHATESTQSLNYRNIFECLNECFPEELLLADAGMARQAASKYRETFQGCFFSAADTATMGWTLGGAIGACFARMCPVIVVIGDGSMLLQGNELATMQNYKLPILVLLLNNNGYKTVAQRIFPDDQTAVNFPSVDWSHYAASFSVSYRHISTIEALEVSFRDIKSELALRSGPILVELVI